MKSCKSYRRTFILVVTLPVIALVCGTIVALNSEFFYHFFPPCTLNMLTGLNCVSCGATRSTLALLHGHFLTAFYYNPLYFIFLCWLLYLYIRSAHSLFVRPYVKYVPNITVPESIGAAVVIVAFFIVRNTSFYQSIFY